MSEFFNQYFDFSLDVEHFDEVLERLLDHRSILTCRRPSWR